MAIGSNEQYAAGPFQANDLIVNNQAMFSNPGMMALVAKEARKGTGGFFEIPNRERKEAPFLTAAKERVNQDLGLSPAVQGGMKNFLGESETVEDAPKKWQSSPDSPATELAYITNKEKDLLLKANLHDSLGDGMPNQGPSGIISLDGGGSYEDETGGRSTSINKSNQSSQMDMSNRQDQDRRQAFRDRTGSNVVTEDEIQGRKDLGREAADISADYAGPDTITQTPEEANPDIRGGYNTTLDLINSIESERQEKQILFDTLKNKETLTPAEELTYEQLMADLNPDFKNIKGIDTDDTDFEDGKSGVIKATTDTAKKIAKQFGISLEEAKTYLKSAGKKGLNIAGVMTGASPFAAVMKMLSTPRPEQLRDPNYLAIMNDVFKKDPKRLQEYMEEHGDIIAEGMAKLPPGESKKGFAEYVSGFMPQEGTEAERRIDPESYYANALRGNTTGELEQLGNTVITDGMSTEFKNKIFAAREAGRGKGDNNNKYQGYSGPVVEKDLVVPDPVTAVEAPVIDPAVGTRDFASGQTYELPTDYRAALTRDGEYGINTDPKSIAYSGGFNQMEDMDEYLKRIGKKRKNYLDADGNPIMTNAMGGL